MLIPSALVVLVVVWCEPARSETFLQPYQRGTGVKGLPITKSDYEFLIRHSAPYNQNSYPLFQTNVFRNQDSGKTEGRRKRSTHEALYPSYSGRFPAGMRRMIGSKFNQWRDISQRRGNKLNEIGASSGRLTKRMNPML